MEQPTARFCRYCERPLHDRSDKLDFGDSCRNAYRRDQKLLEKVEPHPCQKAIFKIISRNYEILKRIYPDSIFQNEHPYVSQYCLPKEFEPDFFTSIHHTEEGLWYVCFDRGWRIVKNMIHIKDFPEKAWLRKDDLKLVK